MAGLSGYAMTDAIAHDGQLTLARARRTADDAPVLLLLPLSFPASPAVARYLERYWHLKDALNPSWALLPRELLRDGAQLALVLEECPGQPLSTLALPMAMEQGLRLATGMARALAGMHQQGVIHKDLTPFHCLVHPRTGETRFIGFGLATQRASGASSAPAPRVIEGTVPYLAPELTGQAHRTLDARADLYAFGVLWYQYFTGSLPCAAGDLLELIHCIVATPPAAPSLHRPELPAPLAEIILRCLAKSPDDRYQTARGVLTDLEQCLAQWDTTGTIAPFPLGAQDIPDRLLIPQRLYGREREIAMLVGCYAETVSQGVAQCLFVSGYAGIGKTALVTRVLADPIMRDEGFLLAGKFDQLLRGTPYATLIQALQELVRRLLTEREERLAHWRARILTAVGINGGVLIDLIPQVELILGPQPPVVALPLTETEHRFHLTVQQFLGVFTARAHPLVLFLDDLQWADPASLRLLQYLLTQPETRNLLCIGAYRDNEVSPSHPLMLTMGALRHAGVAVREVTLAPLALDALTPFVADTLHQDTHQVVAPFVQLLQEKTGGNPFFLIQFLSTLVQAHLLTFDYAQARWVWDLDGIRAQNYTDNVVEFLLARLQRLPERTQQMLALAASIGIRIALTTLATVSEQPSAQVVAAVDAAERAGLIFREDDTYRFLHDRVQQAAYALIPESERPAVHLHIGRLLLAAVPPEEREPRVFDLVSHFTRSLSLLTDPREAIQVAELHLLAGQRAKAAAAYRSAVAFLADGISLLTPDAWTAHYPLAYGLWFERGQCEWLTGNFAAADTLLQHLLPSARGPEDAAAVNRVLLQVVMTLGETRRATEVGLAALRLFDIDFPPHPTADTVQAEYARIWQLLAGRPIEALVQLPAMTDLRHQAVMDTLADLYLPAYWTDVNLLVLVCCRMVTISIEYGNAEASVMGYAGFGRQLAPSYDRYLDAYRFGKVAYDLVERRRLLGYKARIADLFGISTSYWIEPFRQGLDYSQIAFQAARDVGDLTYACYACMHIVNFMFIAGDPLDDIDREALTRLDFVTKAHYEEVADIISSNHRVVLALQGQTTAPTAFSEATFDDPAFEERIVQQRSEFTVCWYFIRKTIMRYLLGQYAEAVGAARRVAPLMPRFMTQVSYPEYIFYAALAFAAHYPSLAADEQPPVLETLKYHQERLRVWAANAPANFHARHALVTAEILRLTGETAGALPYYEDAIQAAQAQGLVHQMALGQELAARCHLEREDAGTATRYLHLARENYARWGAAGKVRQMDVHYTRWLAPVTGGDALTLPVSTQRLDLLAVIRASQAISGPLELPAVIDTLLRTVIERAGAQHGTLLLADEETLAVVATARIHAGAVDIVQRQTPMQTADVPASMLTYVVRTHELVVLEDATPPHRFAGDPYLQRHRPQSVLCVPILRQDRLIGLLYLEHAHLPGAFSADRVAVLELLAAQAAISLENARLYASLTTLNRELERRVQQRTAQLEATNGELEAFTYSVSHDLRAPVRRIAGFSDILQRRYADRLDAEGRDYLEEMRGQAQHMGQLVEDLLGLSRAGRAALQPIAVDLSALAQAVARELQAQEPARRVDWQIPPAVTAEGDPNLLRIVLVNLLGNAWKYTSHSPAARIAFGVARQEGETVYYVRDNGAGFDMANANKLFIPFQRLHTEEEFPGTGIGLTIVQRIIHRHGGRIWAEGKVDAGAAFYFTLPPIEPAPAPEES